MTRMSDYLQIVEEKGSKSIRCHCGRTICSANENFKEHVLMDEGPVSIAGPFVNPYRLGGERFVFRRFCCPGCATLLETEVALKGAPLIWDVQLKPDGGNAW